MKILGIEIPFTEKVKNEYYKELKGEYDKEPNARVFNGGRVINNIVFDGEKNLGEIGQLTNYHVDYYGLRTRSWKAYLDSDIAQTVIKKYTKWVVGAGLKLQAEPNKMVLTQEGYDVTNEELNNNIEARFKVWAKSKMACIKNENTFHRIMNTAYINAVVGGDVLVVLRVIKGNLKIELIDGANLRTPVSSLLDQNFKNGVQTDDSGKVISYHVSKRNNLLETTEIKAYNNGFRVAFLFKGLHYRLSDNRGLPIISAVLESITKLDRYKDATVSSAEELSKIPYQVVHQAYSSGENPASKLLTKAFDVSGGEGGNIPTTDDGTQLATNIAATTQRMAFNNPVGAEIKPMQSTTRELYFKDFFSVNVNLICAALAAPPEVMLSKYDSNFSASRAALKDWEHTLNVERSFFQEEFLQYIYDFWLYIEVLKNKLNVNGILKAVAENNEYAFNAFTQCRFVGANVPHIDPLKEVKAEREKLGTSGQHIPLTTVEQATESLNGGDSMANMEQYAEEFKKSVDLNIPTGKPNENETIIEEE